jgi:hypothetical protein
MVILEAMEINEADRNLWQLAKSKKRSRPHWGDCSKYSAARNKIFINLKILWIF